MKMKPMILLLSAALAGTALAGCGSAASEGTTSENSADTEEITEVSAENEDDVAFNERWFDDLPYFYDEESDQYFEISIEESSDGTAFNVENFGNDWETLYLTADADSYKEEEDGGYTYYDTGVEHSVLTYYPSTNTMVLMLDESTTYNCTAVDVAYGIDPYGFATEYETWWDTYSYQCVMDIRYATYADSGENYYQIEIEWSEGDTDDNVWEITKGTYDEETNSIVFSDCRYYTLTYYADGTEVETDVYTDGTGSISMDENCRLYWNDDQDNMGEYCSFENEGYNYENVYSDYAGTWYCSYTDDSGAVDLLKSYTLDITETDGGGFDIFYQYCYASTYGDQEELSYDIDDAVYDSATGITFHLPEKRTRFEYDSEGNFKGEYDEEDTEWYELDMEYTVVSQEGMLILYKNEDVIGELYRLDEEEY